MLFPLYDETSEYRFIRIKSTDDPSWSYNFDLLHAGYRMLVLTLQPAWLNSFPGNHSQSDSAQYTSKTCPEAEAVSLKSTSNSRKCRSSFPYHTTVSHTSNFHQDPPLPSLLADWSTASILFYFLLNMVFLDLHLRPFLLQTDQDWCEVWKCLSAYLHLNRWNPDTDMYVNSAIVWHH